MTEKEEVVLMITSLIKDWDDYVAAQIAHLRDVQSSSFNIGELKKEWLEIFADYASDKLLEDNVEN